MSILLSLLIFTIILFLYIHIQYQLKKNNDLEYYSFENINKYKLEEAQELRQPIIFYCKSETNSTENSLLTFYNFKNLDIINFELLKEKFKSFDIKVKNMNKSVIVPITIENGLKLLESDNNYISLFNSEFLDETKLDNIIQNEDMYLKPELLMNSYYDIIMGCKDSYTSLNYSKNFKNYLYVTQGKIKIKLTVPDSGKYFRENVNHEHFTFESNDNIWNNEEKNKNRLDKVKFLEFELESGKLISIPPYWWYSFKFEEKENVVLSLSYRTYMNTISILPSLFVSFLQQQNTKFKITE